MSVRRIYLARHGNREDFVDPTWPHRAPEPYDPPLAADGIEQARRLGQRLAGERISAIVVSPFLRTVQTAHYANEALGAPMFLEPGFGEWLNASSFERLPRLASFEGLARDYTSLRADYTPSHELRYPESKQDLLDRTHRSMAELLKKFDGTVLVVGHAASVAAASLIDDRILSVDCPICALFCLEHDGARWCLSLNGDATHVGERLATYTFP